MGLITHGPVTGVQDVVSRISQQEEIEDLTKQLGPDSMEEGGTPTAQPIAGR